MRTNAIPTHPPWMLIILGLLALLIVGMLGYSVIEAVYHPAEHGRELLR